MGRFNIEDQVVTLNKELKGNILDIGGGGEGIIGHLYGKNVTAIDKRQDELDEVNNEANNILMDATNLTFKDNTFDHATSFFTLMYMSHEDQLKVLKEVKRILKPGGSFTIWDVSVPENRGGFDVFVVYLLAKLPDKKITTGYGSKYKELSAQHFTALSKQVGYTIKNVEHNDQTYKITLTN